MPRPTAAQFAYGSATVVLSTLAMLLLSKPGSGTGLAVVACAGLALGLLVAMTVPMPRVTRQPRRTGRAPGVRHRRPGADDITGRRDRSGSAAPAREHVGAGTQRR